MKGFASSPMMSANYGTNMAGVIDGLSNTVMVAELRAGKKAVDPRGVWALGFPSSSIVNAGRAAYLTVDPAGRRVYVSHATVVDVLDADTGEIKGQIPDTAGVHGIAVAADLGRGFTSNGRANTVTAFDLKTLKPLATIKTGRNPDAILYDPATRRVFAFNGGGKSATVIDATDDKVVGTIELGGKPEGTTTDAAGHVFVNLEDTAEVLRLDARELKVLARWSVTGSRADRRGPCCSVRGSHVWEMSPRRLCDQRARKHRTPGRRTGTHFHTTVVGHAESERGPVRGSEALVRVLYVVDLHSEFRRLVSRGPETRPQLCEVMLGLSR